VTTRFDTDTAVQPLDAGARSDDRARSFSARIDPGWWIVAGPNGGYLAAILLRAFEGAVADPARTPRSLTIHYTAPPAQGPVRIDTTVERAGRSLTTVSARMLQDDRLIVLALAAFSKPRSLTLTHSAVRMPEVPPPERCPRLDKKIEIHDRYEHRWAIGAPPFGGGDQAQCGGWIRLTDPRPLHAPLAAAYTDSFPPALYSLVSDEALAGGVPTIDLTIHFRAPLPRPGASADEFTLAVFRTHTLREGFLEEDGELWSADGQLLVQSRQLALAR
jgi:acyl-CoA thioesterase